MTYPVLNIITDAMADLGALAIEETPTNAEAASGLRALNNLVETWNNESLMIYNVFPQTFAYVSNQQSYTMGTGGNFNADRPVKIERALNRTGIGQNQTDYPIYVTNNADEYSSIITKQITTTLPVVLYYNGDSPLQTLFFWPVPIDTTYAPVLWVWGMVTSFANMSDDVELPPGYRRALQKNLAIELSPAYGREPSTSLMKQAIESKSQLKRINHTVNTLAMPTGIPGAGAPYALPQFLMGI